MWTWYLRGPDGYGPDMAEILVTADGDLFDVTLTDGASTSRHEVDASPSELSALGLENHDPRAVVEESLRFLLEREPKESIMGTFALSTITGFFSDYPTEIKRRMQGELD